MAAATAANDEWRVQARRLVPERRGGTARLEPIGREAEFCNHALRGRFRKKSLSQEDLCFGIESAPSVD
ncbi:UNVERIFIED_CONTAM: hypothetical protein K2H54_044212 [Gekko kuhli]